jgi:hypothetical protein
VPTGKDNGVAHIDLMWMAYDDATSFRKVGAVLDFLKKGTAQVSVGPMRDASARNCAPNKLL